MIFVNITQSRKRGLPLFFFGTSSCQILHTAVLWRCDENTQPPTDTNFALHPSQAAFMTHAVCAPFNGIQEARSNSWAPEARAKAGDPSLPLYGYKEHVFKRKPQKSQTQPGHLQSGSLYD